MLLAVIVSVALVVRVALDLAGFAKPDWRLDTAYAVLFVIVAGALLAEDQRDVFGYGCLLIAGFCAIRAAKVARR